MSKKMVACDANEATAFVAHKVSEVIAIYPITPSTPMAEHSDAWSAKGRTNMWGQVPQVMEMQSEGGAAGAVHGALQAGALTTTFTASQGLLLMIPNMFKIAGELAPTVFHVAARSLAMQGLSIFGDHSDVMSCRQTGFGMLASCSVQEAQDIALITHASTLKTRVPFIHFFDGFRTSHEVMKIEQISEDVIESMIDDKLVTENRHRAMTPDAPTLRGSAQNPDVYFQGRETVNAFYNNTPAAVQAYMDQFAKETGRQYNLVEYSGAPDAEKVIVIMGSGAQTVSETVDALVANGEKVGVLNVRLFRPFPTEAFLNAIPASVKKISVLDRCKEPGSAGEPLYQDVCTALTQGMMAGSITELPMVVGGRFGLSSKEFTPAMVKGVYDALNEDKPKNSFTIGINDDVTFTSLSYDPSFLLEKDWFEGMFFGLGADGTVGANKNSIKIIGNSTDNYSQGYFVYDSKKSGSMTISHLRFGKDEIRAPYLIQKANFIACHHTPHMDQLDILDYAKEGGTFLMNSHQPMDKVWDSFPVEAQKHILDKNLKVYVIDGFKVGKESGMGRRINTIMQTCFFGISDILPAQQAIDEIKNAIKKSYASKGDKIIEMNIKAVDMAMDNLNVLDTKGLTVSSSHSIGGGNFAAANSEFVTNFTAVVAAGKGDSIPVSLMPNDGVFPTGTTQYEKRDLTLEAPIWNEDICIQCGKCAIVCPHAAIRVKAYDEDEMGEVPETFKSIPAKGVKLDGKPRFTVQVSSLDCTGCGVCVEACPAIDKVNPGKKSINMADITAIKDAEAKNFDYFTKLPEIDRSKVNRKTVKGTQLLQPMFEFSGACAGCGETAYIKLASQLFGDRMMIANATGCTSIYGGNLPTTPWTKDSNGRGPAWANSLFEDNAEFGLGIRLGVNKHYNEVCSLLTKASDKVGADVVKAIIEAPQAEEADIMDLRIKVGLMKDSIRNDESLAKLYDMADYLVKKSVWIMGGDGWAYDIGYGGLDHVLSTGENVNIMVLDTEVYSNTGGQASKATQTGAIAQFAAAGKKTGKKDLALIAMSYKNVYVGRISLGANDNQTIKTLLEAEAYDGPSLILAYSPCIAHGFDLNSSLNHEKMAVESGYWPLMRYNPMLADEGKNPLTIDSKAPSIPVKEYIYTENRFKQLLKSDPEAANILCEKLQKSIDDQWTFYQHMASGIC